MSDASVDYHDCIELISARAVGRYDVAELFADPGTLEAVVGDLAAPFRDAAPDAVAGIEALGFVLGTGVARGLDVGALPVRKGGELPLPDSDVVREALTEYTGARKPLEIDATSVREGSRVLVDDDWIETAAQTVAATALVERAGDTVAGIAVLDAETSERSRALVTEYDLHTANPGTDLP